MATDCGFSRDNDWFRYRTGAILVRDGKMLFVKSMYGGYYYMVGGGVHTGETSSECVERETFEETGAHCTANRIAIITENLFRGHDGAIDGKNCHVLEFYYLLTVKDMSGLKTVTDDGEELCWIDIDKVPASDIKPSFVPERIGEILNSTSILHILEERDR